MNLKKFRKFELQVDGKKILYLKSGKGPTILFLHGLGIDTNIWDHVYAHIQDRFTIVLLDLPGYGLNIDFHIASEFNVLTKFINDFIEINGSIDYLIGYSLSGTFSYQIAQNPPISLKKIFCISAPIFSSNFIVIFNWIFKVIGSNHMITKIVKFFIVHFPMKQLIFFIGGLASIKNPKAMDECMDKFGEKLKLPYIFTSASSIFLPTQFAPVTIPVDFIYGELDRFATPAMAIKAQQYCKNSLLHIVKDVYHLMPLERPLELALLIEKNCNFNKIGL